MLIRVKNPDDIPENAVTPESDFLNRRALIKNAGRLILAHASVSPLLARATQSGNPAKRNSEFDWKDKNRAITDEKLATTYNNFYEFSLDKNEVARRVDSWKLGAWPIEIGGLIDKPIKIDAEDLVKKFGVEERVYRFRCVEAWSMVVPWTGFPLSKLIAFAKPKSTAKYIRFSSIEDKSVGVNMGRLLNYPWPYTEGLTLEEAQHPLTMLVTGMYGKPLPKQNGAPLRLIVPWKYGFKSIKSIMKIDFVATQPKTLWQSLASEEYGFYANVNPDVSHPRWSQASERILNGSFFPTKIPTQKFNGYEKEVAQLYSGLDLKKNF